MFAIMKQSKRAFFLILGLIAILMCGSATLYTRCDGEAPPGVWVVDHTNNRLDLIMGSDGSSAWIGKCIIEYNGNPFIQFANGEIDWCQAVTRYPPWVY